MNRQRLHDIAARTGNVNDAEISEIKQLISRFPFYALPHMVLAKIFYEKEHYLFENALTQAAMRVPDRAALYHYINGENEGAREAGTNAAVAETEWMVEEGTETAEELITENTESPEQIETKNNLSEFLEEPISAQEDTPTEMPEELPVPVPVETIIEEQNITPAIEEPEITLPEAEEEEIIKDEPEIAAQEPVEAINDLSEAEEETALNIALNLRKHPVYNVEEFLQNSEKSDGGEVSEEKDFFYWLQHPKPEEKHAEPVAEPEPGPDERLSIIDQFIRSNPAISRPKKEFFNAENMAKKSEYLDLDFVSETLANIYYEQGNIDLAIKAYEKLSLQNPLKQAYFATLIEKIKKEKR